FIHNSKVMDIQKDKTEFLVSSVRQLLKGSEYKDVNMTLSYQSDDNISGGGPKYMIDESVSNPDEEKLFWNHFSKCTQNGFSKLVVRTPIYGYSPTFSCEIGSREQLKISIPESKSKHFMSLWQLYNNNIFINM